MFESRGLPYIVCINLFHLLLPLCQQDKVRNLILVTWIKEGCQPVMIPLQEYEDPSARLCRIREAIQRRFAETFGAESSGSLRTT